MKTQNTAQTLADGYPFKSLRTPRLPSRPDISDLQKKKRGLSSERKTRAE